MIKTHLPYCLLLFLTCRLASFALATFVRIGATYDYHMHDGSISNVHIYRYGGDAITLMSDALIGFVTPFTQTSARSLSKWVQHTCGMYEYMSYDLFCYSAALLVLG